MSYMLEGLKVIDAASYLAAPATATMLGDFGADVIKIEAPGGDGYRLLSDSNWLLTSRNKKSICLDLRKEAGRKILHQLIDEADVLLTNFLEPQIKQFELEYEQLRKTNLRLVYAHVSGYGRRGPEKNRRGFDLAGFWARTGIQDVMRPYGGAPVHPAGGSGDHVTALALLSGIMMALYDREKTGQGRMVSSSLAASGCYTNGMAIQAAIAGHDREAVLEKNNGMRAAFSNLYQTRDDRHVMLIIVNPRKEFSGLAKSLGHEEWLEDPRFAEFAELQKNKYELTPLVAEAMREFNLVDICKRMDEYDLPYSAVERVADVIRDAQLIENEVIVKTDSDMPEYQWTINSPINIEGERKRTPTTAPDVGQHSEDVLRELGLGADRISALIEDGAVVQGPERER